MISPAVIRVILLIPASMENRSIQDAPCTKTTVYPHACGERLGMRRMYVGWPGLSPRLRGTVYLSFLSMDCIRFIPAPAGNGAYRRTVRANGAVYPRACGERMYRFTRWDVVCGLSPRLRGTAPQSTPIPLVPRFIPAPAGNGFACKTKMEILPVYPRACGERDSV